MTEEQRMARELRSVRAHHEDPIIDFDVDVNELDRVARNELKTLTKENAETVAKHLVMAVRLIDSDPELAHQHVLSASRRAGRIAVVRETLGITAYATGDFALALREMRTFRRISGSNEQIALMVDSERGVGRSDKALELGRSVDRATLTEATQVALAIAMSGARLDLDQPDLALGELEIPQLDPTKAFSYSPELFRAYAEVLEELGRTQESAEWLVIADVADTALETSPPAGEDESDEDIIVIEEELDGFEDHGYEDDDETVEEKATMEEIHAEELSADDVASLFDEVVVSADAGLTNETGEPAPKTSVTSSEELDFDEDLLEEDVAQVLRDTAHLANEANEAGEKDARA